MTLRCIGLTAIAMAASACLELVDLPPKTTPSAREKLREFCTCFQFDGTNLRPLCERFADEIPDDARTVALAAGECSTCGDDTFDVCWEELSQEFTNELCPTTDGCSLRDVRCDDDGDCCSGACVFGSCAGCEAGQPVDSDCRTSAECASLACRFDFGGTASGAVVIGTCAASCTACDALTGPAEGAADDLCVSAADEALGLLDCLCDITRSPDSMMAQFDKLPAACVGIGKCKPVASAEACIQEVSTEPGCRECLLEEQANCTQRIQDCQSTEPEPAVGE